MDTLTILLLCTTIFGALSGAVIVGFWVVYRDTHENERPHDPGSQQIRLYKPSRQRRASMRRATRRAIAQVGGTDYKRRFA